MLLQDVIGEYLDDLEGRNYSEKTTGDYGNELKRFRLWVEGEFNGPVYAEELAEGTVEDYFSHLDRDGISPVYRNKILYILRGFFEHTSARGITGELTGGMRLAKTRSKQRDYLTDREMGGVLEAMGNPLIRQVTIFLYNTGARIGECLSLELGDLDFKNREIKIRKGKGNKDRRLPMNTRLAEELAAYIEGTRPEMGTERVFISPLSGGLSQSYYNRRLKRAVRKAGIENKQITAHCIRHSTAMRMREQGVDIYTIKEQLGHEEIATTSIYLHSEMEEMKKAVETI
ncbi:tyrosine-type recombinase/integrase [Halarsenatibacter silvermanii]|uniref:Integrase/recombinase XerD n=1 Tax=Halarsenatibacter silvermanii TaxID=321763 RepID=A0A1G9HR35_9FIRM|nr:tyrosine-type recombinase/integrase [Halarsenatibacter silvermanii]SDL15174.1 integrase/recombinase XerD [Halarsenatibacter silvermanii]